ncbi:MAG: hypothetical protein J5372_08060 [Lachnospiraceae bacterium]|nr:hypothetical protein [Lachnospiraceae bacterium]
MTYDDVQNFISKECTSGSVYGLDRIKELVKRLGNPEKDMKIIHIAGTNGKGSISRMIMSVLACSGYKVGIFNSPFLDSRREYLCINGENATDEGYALTGKKVIEAIKGIDIPGKKKNEMSEYPTEFEFSFAMALKYFADNECDFAIVECGLGGLTDATNIFEDKVLSIIANIGLDHTKLLGNSIKEITEQKCGIIIKNDIVVAYPSDKEAMSVIKKVCRKNRAWLITPDYKVFNNMNYYDPGLADNIKKSDYKYLPDAEKAYADTVDSLNKFMCSSRVEKVWLSMPYLLDRLNLKGAFQKKNAMVALASVMALKYKGYLKKVSFTSIEKGFKNVTWPGRFETLLKKPLVIADGGHNMQCTKALIESLDEEDIKKAIFVIGIMADKDYKEVFKLLTPYMEQVITTEPSNPRRLDAEDICECIRTNKESISGFTIEKDPCKAVKKAIEISNKDYSCKMPVIVTGSLYMMADIRKAVK